MTTPAQRKGDGAEREVVKLLRDLGWPEVRRARVDSTGDRGDLAGIPDLTVEVKNYTDIARAVRVGLADLAKEQANAGTTFGVLLVRRPGGKWIAVQELGDWAALAREAGL